MKKVFFAENAELINLAQLKILPKAPKSLTKSNFVKKIKKSKSKDVYVINKKTGEGLKLTEKQVKLLSKKQPKIITNVKKGVPVVTKDNLLVIPKNINVQKTEQTGKIVLKYEVVKPKIKVKPVTKLVVKVKPISDKTQIIKLKPIIVPDIKHNVKPKIISTIKRVPKQEKNIKQVIKPITPSKIITKPLIKRLIKLPELVIPKRVLKITKFQLKKKQPRRVLKKRVKVAKEQIIFFTPTLIRPSKKKDEESIFVDKREKIKLFTGAELR